MNVIIIGHRGSGKTSVGAELSKRLASPFYDSDVIIERDTGCTIPQLVEIGGWSFFRQKEREAISKMSSLKNSVIATGGGAVMDSDNADLLRRLGIIIWLMADVETILHRLKKDQEAALCRPSLNGGDLFSETALVLTKRSPIYRDLADFAVDTSTMSIEQVVEEIDEHLQRCGKMIGRSAGYGGKQFGAALPSDNLG